MPTWPTSAQNSLHLDAVGNEEALYHLQCSSANSMLLKQRYCCEEWLVANLLEPTEVLGSIRIAASQLSYCHLVSQAKRC